MSSDPVRGGSSDSFPRSFMLVCGATGQFQRLRGYDCDFASIFIKRAARDDIWFWNTFAKPIEGISGVLRHSALATSGRLTPLERLPNELLDLTLDSLIKNRLSVLALTLASPILYPKILSRIHREYAHGRVASWAGKEVGFYGRSSSVPPAPILRFLPDLDDFHPDEEPWYHDLASVSTQFEHPWCKSLTEAHRRWREVHQAVRRNIEEDLSQEYMYPQDRVWVLRNFSKRQYVRSNRLEPPKAIIKNELSSEKTHPLMSSLPTGSSSILLRVRAVAPLTLPQVLLVLTAYSAHPDWREEDFVSGSGPWVSDAFEVITLDEHMENATPDWEDVSIEVAADVGHLRWCVMQHAALSESGVEGLWQRLKEFGRRVPASRAMWTRWRKVTKDEDRWDADCCV